MSYQTKHVFNGLYESLPNYQCFPKDSGQQNPDNRALVHGQPGSAPAFWGSTDTVLLQTSIQNFHQATQASSSETQGGQGATQLAIMDSLRASCLDVSRRRPALDRKTPVDPWSTGDLGRWGVLYEMSHESETQRVCN